MGGDYEILAGSKFKVFPEKRCDYVLIQAIENILVQHACVEAFAVFQIRASGFFTRRNRAICVLHNDAKAYEDANRMLAGEMERYCLAKKECIDCMSFDLTIPSEREFAESLKLKIGFIETKEGRSKRSIEGQ